MWCQVQATSAISGQGCPLVRSKHAMCSASDGRIYLYGGKSLLNQTLRDLWRFDTNENCWEQMKCPRIITNNNNEHHIVEEEEEEREDNNTTFNNKQNQRSNQLCQTCRTFSSNDDDPEWNNNNESCSFWNSINDGPPPLQEHTIIGYKNKLYVFGGEIGYSSDETPLWIFDLQRLVWKKFSTSSAHQPTMNAICRPLGRRGHSAVVYQNIMCIYGGYQDIKGSTSEIWTFNLDTEEWYLEGTNFKKDASPLARHGHSAVVYKDSMYVYGGMSNLNVRGDFWAWNFKSKEWNRVKSKSHKTPGVLSFHSAIVVLDSMFIYGGERSNGNNTNELWRYRFANQTWEHIEIKGIAPSCRTRHVAVANPFLMELENSATNANNNSMPKSHQMNVVSVSDWQQQPKCNCNKKQAKNNNNHADAAKTTKRHKHNARNNKTQTKINCNETSFAESTESSATENNIKSISMCFDNTEKSPSSIFSNTAKEDDDDLTQNDKLFTKNSLTVNSSTIIDNTNDSTTVTDTFIKQLASSALFIDELLPNSNDEQENNRNLLNSTINNNSDGVGQSTQTQTTTTVRMRPRRPQLQKQRPYSDFYGAPSHLPDDFDFNELNETQFKRRSVQESMSYYSLCFSTPPAHSLKQKRSPSPPIALISPAIEPIDDAGMIIQSSTSDNQSSLNQIISSSTFDDQYQNKKLIVDDVSINAVDNTINKTESVNTNPQYAVKRRENFVSKRRLRKSDLFELSSLALKNPAPKQAFSTVYSLTLDISPDFEKELKFSTNSTPSNDLNSCSVSTEHYEYESIEMTHLDMLEDYLEPEEMLEIVTESASGEEISSSLNIKTIPRTPARSLRNNNHEKNLNRNHIHQQSKDTTQQQQQTHQVQHQSSATSVSNSSSGYQSLILSSDSNANSFEISSNPSISNSSSFAEQQQQQTQENKKQTDYLSVQKLVSKLSDSFSSNKTDINRACIESKQINLANDLQSKSKDDTNNNKMKSIQEVQCKTRPNHLNRLSHWQPNIKEVIEEVAIPGSPAIIHHDSPFISDIEQDESSDVEFNDGISLSLIDDSFVQYTNNNNNNYRDNRQSNIVDNNNSSLNHIINNINNNNKNKKTRSIDQKKQHPIFCMYVFGGKEDCITGVLNKQSMTIWKYYT